MGSSSLLLFPSSSSAAPPPHSAAYSHATSSHSLLPPLPSSQDHLLLHYLHHHLEQQHQESAAAAMVRKRPAPDMDLPPPRRHVTGDLSDVTAAAAGGQPHQSSPASVQLPALPTQLQLPAFQQQHHHHHAHAEVDVPHTPPPAPAEVAASTTAWVDGIIRDIIGSSGGAGVSITQLIHNVREIIHPCNPGLASLLELRLRSLLNADPAPPPLPHPPALLHGSTPPAAAPTVRPALPPPPPLPVPDKRRHEPQQEEPNPSPQSPKPPTAEEAAAAAAAAKERKEEQRRKQRDEEGLHLLTLLLQCAESVNADNLDDAHLTLLEIAELATPFGTSTQRVAAYFAEAMSARLVSSCLGLYALAARLHGCVAAAFQVFSGISPLVKFNGAPTRGSASPTSPTRSAEIGITRAVGRANRIQATAEVGGGSCSAMEDLRPGIRRRRGEDDLLACAADGHDTLLEQADPKEAAPAGDPLVRREHNLRPAAAGVRQRLSSKHAGSRVASVDHAVSSMRQSSSPRLLSMAGSSTATHAEAQSGH